MPDTQTLFTRLYAAFNRRDIDACLACMSETVSWPKASEGGRVTGKEEIRAYWLRQWSEFNPAVEPVEITSPEPDKAEVKVHQVVRTLDGTLLSDQQVRHVYLLTNGLIERMDVLADSSGFTR